LACNPGKVVNIDPAISKVVDWRILEPDFGEQNFLECLFV
jgi:hypothetical protein